MTTRQVKQEVDKASDHVPDAVEKDESGLVIAVEMKKRSAQTNHSTT